MESSLVFLRSLAVLFILAVDPGHASCSFPTGLTSGTWRSTRWDDLTFTSSQLTVPDLDDLGTNVVFNCDFNSGTKYLIRSASTVTILTNDVEIVACMDFSNGIDAIKTVYYHATNELFLPSGASQPVRLVAPGTSITVSDTCTVTTYATGTHDLLIETDQISSSVITCPDPLLANFNNYTVTMSSTSTSHCTASGGYISVCDQKNTVQVDYSVCSTVILYSSELN
ncbi:hypothetical protein PoB_000421400 [Plakobranchus ocellatus]|uniref:Uncharacterized protein n=1 Tax=Plakobranchus ocellatus TaxID=259542 RepID=A0AAV3Y6J8_9GAST|nr:hypothetical protein PoB_000421400 [Plakobranchus ocellatus]